MITLELDADLAPPERAVILTNLRALIPHCDPDGRGRIEVRIGALPSARTRVEVTCAAPRARAIAIGDDVEAALRRAFARIASRVQESA